MNTLALISGLISLARQSIPLIEDLRRNGVITPEQEAQIKSEWEAFVRDGDKMFDAPHWKKSTDQ